ncbi:MAG: radical SAM family heme chaperone HemW [Lachnoclostridium sp.]|nr:radical SAM family heme chaperone HemW [Lachnoclostridium sp.]
MRSTLYIHIPFCHSKCAYCDFFSVGRSRLSDDFVDALCAELRFRRDPSSPHTIYIGGGTPSSLSDDQLSRIISAIGCRDDVAEFTLEVNPEDVTPARAAHWRDMGIDRISMGFQSFDDEMLHFLGRRHNAADSIEAFDTLRRCGFTNISCDLIYALPGQSLDQWQESLDKLIALRPEHISAYALGIEPGTRLYAMLQSGKIKETDPLLVEQMYDYLTRATRHAGYEHYEISNFALPHRRAIHNSCYWDMTPYLGIGPGASGFDGITRYHNRPDIKQYIAGSGISSRIDEPETVDEQYNDMVMTALRTSAGLPLAEVSRRFGSAYLDYLTAEASPLLRRGLLQLHNSTLTIPEDRWLVSNDIISTLLVVSC